MAFLAGAKNVARADRPRPTRDSLRFTRYTFDIDGPGYANYVRDQLQTRACGSRG